MTEARAREAGIYSRGDTVNVAFSCAWPEKFDAAPPAMTRKWLDREPTQEMHDAVIALWEPCNLSPGDTRELFHAMFDAAPDAAPPADRLQQQEYEMQQRERSADVAGLIARLQGYNPVDRTIDSQRQIAQDIQDAAARIEAQDARFIELGNAFQTAQNETLLALRAAEARCAELERQIVPREPTEEMHDAVVALWEPCNLSPGDTRELWQAMYDAAIASADKETPT